MIIERRRTDAADDATFNKMSSSSGHEYDCNVSKLPEKCRKLERDLITEDLNSEGKYSDTNDLLRKAAEREIVDVDFIRAKWHLTSGIDQFQEVECSSSQQNTADFGESGSANEEQQYQQNVNIAHHSHQEMHTPPLLRKELFGERSPLQESVADILMETGLATVATQDRLDVIQDHMYRLQEREGEPFNDNRLLLGVGRTHPGVSV
eukprot:m.799266 g.799266  ORF g.799266 m.799266 type:complete len:207 (-) comp23352_c0_seq48:2490-3110(-)